MPAFVCRSESALPLPPSPSVRSFSRLPFSPLHSLSFTLSLPSLSLLPHPLLLHRKTGALSASDGIASRRRRRPPSLPPQVRNQLSQSANGRTRPTPSLTGSPCLCLSLCLAESPHCLKLPEEGEKNVSQADKRTNLQSDDAKRA